MLKEFSMEIPESPVLFEASFCGYRAWGQDHYLISTKVDFEAELAVVIESAVKTFQPKKPRMSLQDIPV